MKHKSIFTLAVLLVALTGYTHADGGQAFFQLDDKEVAPNKSMHNYPASEVVVLHDKGLKGQSTLYITPDHERKEISSSQWGFGLWQDDEKPKKTDEDSKLFRSAAGEDSVLSFDVTTYENKRFWLRSGRYGSSIGAGIATMGALGYGLGKLAYHGFSAWTNYFNDSSKQDMAEVGIFFGGIALAASVTSGILAYLAVSSYMKKSNKETLKPLREKVLSQNRRVHASMNVAHQGKPNVPLTDAQMKVYFPPHLLKTKKGKRVFMLPQTTEAFVQQLLPSKEDTAENAAIAHIDHDKSVAVPGQYLRPARDYNNLEKRVFTPSKSKPKINNLLIPYYSALGKQTR